MKLGTLMRKFATEADARRWFERARWPEGPVCPACGVMDRASRIRTRPHQMTCLDCRHRYSVTSGTALHNTKLPLRTWLIAMYLIATRSKGVSAMKLSDWLGISYKSAWHLGHRIRSMMGEDPTLLAGLVEIDETYVGGKPRKRERALPREERPIRKQGRATDKTCVFVAVQRGGRVIPRIVPSHTKGALCDAVRTTTDPISILLTDELPAYIGVGRAYAGHLRVRHSADEFARTCENSDVRVHVNTAESFNAILKRGIVGVFHYVSPKHLHRYAAAFRWNEREPSGLERLGRMVASSFRPLPYQTLTA